MNSKTRVTPFVKSRWEENIQEDPNNKRIYLYTYIRPFSFLGALIGLFPFNRFYRENGPGQYKYCSFGLLHCLVILILFGVSVFLHLFYTVRPKFDDLGSFPQLLDFIFAILASSTSLACAVVHFASHKHKGKIFQKLKELDEILPTHEENTIDSFRYSNWGFLTFYILTQSVYFVYMTKIDKSQGSQPMCIILIIANILTTLYTVAVPFFILLQGAGFCICTATLCCNFNENLKEVLSPLKTMGSGESNEVKTSNFIVNSFVAKLEHMRSTHLKIWSLTQTINDHLSFQLLLVLLSCFAVSCYNVFTVLKLLKHRVGNKSAGLHVGTALSNFVAVGILAWAVDLQEDKYSEAMEILNGCEIPFIYREISSYLARFSIQVLQMKTSMDIIGLFSVNRAFFLAMIATITHYIILLLKFEG